MLDLKEVSYRVERYVKKDWKENSKKKKVSKPRGRKPSIVETLRKHPKKYEDTEIFFRLIIAEYLFGKEGEFLSDKEKAKRRSILAKKLGRSEQTLKAMYRLGQGSFHHSYSLGVYFKS